MMKLSLKNGNKNASIPPKIIVIIFSLFHRAFNWFNYFFVFERQYRFQSLVLFTTMF